MKNTVYRFAVPYTFDGETYTEVDFAGAEKLKGKILHDAQLHAGRKSCDGLAFEKNLKIFAYLANAATGRSMEFFEDMDMEDGMGAMAFFYDLLEREAEPVTNLSSMGISTSTLMRAQEMITYAANSACGMMAQNVGLCFAVYSVLTGKPLHEMVSGGVADAYAILLEVRSLFFTQVLRKAKEAQAAMKASEEAETSPSA